MGCETDDTPRPNAPIQQERRVIMEFNLLTSSVITLALVGILGWLLRKWLGTKIESVYQQKDESFRATIQQENEASLIAMRDRLEKQAQLQSSAFSSFAAAQQALMKKRLKAAEAIWSEVLSFNDSLPPIFGYMDILTIEEYPDAHIHGSGRELFAALSEEEVFAFATASDREGRKGWTVDGLAKHRLYVDEQLWSIFALYRAIMTRIWLQLVWSKENPDLIYWFRDKYTRAMMEAALTPEELEDLDQARIGKIENLRDKLERRILAELRRMISGEVSGSDSFEQAMKYQRLASEGILNRLADDSTGLS